MKNKKTEYRTKQYKELSIEEKEKLFGFIKSFKNPLSPDSIEKMDTYYNGGAFNLGTSHYSGWKEGEIVSSLGYVDKEIPTKKEAYMTSVYCSEGHEKALESLYGKALGLSKYKSDFVIKLGFFHSMKQPIDVFLEKGFREEYHLLEMSYDLKKEWNENPHKFEQELTYEVVGMETLEKFLQIHNDAFIKSPNGAVMDEQDGKATLDEKKDQPWQLLLFKKKTIPVAIAILAVKGVIGTIEGLAVDPLYEGQGNGKKALWALMKIMAEHGVERTLLQVMDNNKRAYKLYVETGFQMDHIHSDWYTMSIEESSKMRHSGEPTEIDAFLDRDGRLTHLPMKKEIRQLVLSYLAEKFLFGEAYTEKQINHIISEWHTFNDFFLLRRELVDYKYLHRTRDGSRYWREIEPK